MKYDYLIVGAGLAGAVFAYRAKEDGKRCLVVEKRPNVGGNLYCEEVEGIRVHKYGAHIFHTDNQAVWDFVNRFSAFNNYINSPIANFKGELYNMPFNMNTFYRMFGTKTPEEAMARIESEKGATQVGEPKNLEEKAISLVGRTIYEKLVKGYTEKQWGRAATELPAFIIGRLPLRFTYDNNYFNDRFQGIPIGGYNVLIEGLLEGTEVRCGVDYFKDKDALSALADKVVFSGGIDEYYGYRFGTLEYRTVRFETETLDTENYQGVAVVNYTDAETPYTRCIEHKHFEGTKCPKTVISREHSEAWTVERERYYPINDGKNNALYQKYRALADGDNDVFFIGRLGEYKYYDMDDVIERTLQIYDSAQL